MDAPVTLRQAAHQLGVSRRRVQALIESGSLPAEKVGHQWLVDARQLRLLEHNMVRTPGRPPSPAKLWASIAALAAGEARPKVDDLDGLRRRLRNRARHRAYYVHPGVLRDALDAEGAVLGGRSAASEAGAPVDDVEPVDIYMPARRVENWERTFRARPAPDRPNVVLHAVDDEAWPFEVGQRVAGPWVAWLDLADRQDRAADVVLDRLIGGRAHA